MSKQQRIWLILGVIFISFNLRAPITAVGSLVGRIQTDYTLSSGMAGFITTLPLLAFAVASPFVSRVARRLGTGRTVLAGLVLIFCGVLLRSYTNVAGLYLGTTVLGVGIAIGNVLIPGIIKLKFSDCVGQMTSIYTSSMCIFAAVGAGVSVPLADGLALGWNHALAVWGLLALVTALLWLPQCRGGHLEAGTKNAGRGSNVWKSATAWWVTLFMGIQSLLFYSLVAWLPTILVSRGMTEAFAGTMASVFQLTAIPATLLIPALCDRFRSQRGLALATCAVYGCGMVLLLLGHSAAVLTTATLLLALGMGGSISLAIAFLSLRSPNAATAAQLSGMSQSAGYLLAAVGPMVVGMIYDRVANWSVPVVLFLALIGLLAVCGWQAGRDCVVQEP